MLQTKSTRTALTVIVCCAALAVRAHAGPPQPATPDDIAKMVAEAGDKDKYDGADYVDLLDEADVYVRPSGLATTESCRLIKVLTDAGVKQQCVQRFDFDPATRRVTIKSLRIHRKDGGVENVPLNDIITQPTVQRWIFWGGDQHVVSVPNLAAGDTIELHVSKIGFNIAYLAGANETEPGETLQPPMPGHWYEVTLFQGHHPVVHKRYSVHMPKEMPIQYEVYNGPLKTSLWTTDNYNVYTFTADDLPAIKSEPHMVALDDCVPKVVMATVPDWEMKSRWFHEANIDQFKANDEIREKVAELTKGLSNIEDKVAACNHWVADNIRYYGTSRGPCEGFTLHKGAETFRDRGGVCKDKAGMLVTMLRVLGVEAHPALTMAGSRVEDIPADQFNHTVTVMKDQAGEWKILDPTWIPLSREMWSSREALQGLVYGTPEGETLTLSPYYPPSYNQLTSRSQSRIDADGTLHAEIAMSMSGYPDTYLRRNLESHWRPNIKHVFEEVVNIAPTAVVEKLNYTDPYDYAHDATVEMLVSADNYTGGGESACVFRLPLMKHPLADWLIPDLFNDFSAETREYGMHMRATRGLHYEETVQLPNGWHVTKLPDNQTLESPAADLTFTASADGAKLTYTFELNVKQHLIEAKDYPKFKKAIDAMKDISNAWVVCERTQPENGESKHAWLNRKESEVHND
ncbi:MAG: DUF3857 domain-containing protein [Phycisphaerales bacterium]|nr:DUF3857 domain-containing protein [Phycisphaerales bacterium]